jgi:hypothetical protein
MDEFSFLADDWYPSCFNSYKQYTEWRKYANYTGVNGRSYCIDCTRKYKYEMGLEKRCDPPRHILLMIKKGLLPKLELPIT